ncbi:MAG: glycosyltransferase family 2 protein [Gemmatimonadota bacterium]|nr:glycosyltransferase family 2 protein [Gemmatimonadota bacterium]
MIYFFIPAFDEQETVGVLLYRLREVMSKVKLDYTVLLTLDGCRDNTSEVISQYFQLMPIHVIDHPRTLGYGKSLAEVVKRVSTESRNPKRDFFLVLDADFTQDPGKFNGLFEQIERNLDLCYGNRFAGTGNGVSWQKRLANFLVHRVLRFRGIEHKKAGSDLLTTLRGCRVRLLRRNLKQLKMLDRYGPEVPPAGVAMLFLLMLYGDARKYYEIKFSDKLIRRRGSRFRLFSLLRFTLFGEFPEPAPPAPEQARQPSDREKTRRRRPSRRRKSYSNKRRPDSSKVQERKGKPGQSP